MKLRPYQQAAIDAVRRDWQRILDVLLVAATGAGKTQMFLRLLMDILDETGGRGLILAHRTELIDQPLERIGQMDAAWLMSGVMSIPRVGVIQAERELYDRQLTIATVQSLAVRRKVGEDENGDPIYRYPRLEKLIAHGPITHLVIDECHHGTAETYIRIIEALREVNSEMRHVGVTATPIRADGDGLAKIYQTASAKITIADLVRDGWLVKPRWLAISTGISIDGVHTRSGDYVASELADRFDTPGARQIITDAYRTYAAGRRAIAFTASVKGAHELADAFTNIGITAASVDGTTPKDVRAAILADFRAGRIQVLCNCQVLTEGFDAPGTSCVLMCRPTKSDGLYIQCMGRGLRPANGKAAPDEDCLILDFMPEDVRNIVMAGDVLGVPKEEADAVRKLVEEQEPGEEQIGFTFDGHDFDYHGSPMEIIARQLDYLNQSRLAWFPPNGVRQDGDILTVGLGAGSDRTERILAIRDGRLYGIARRQTLPGDRPEPWAVREISCEDVYEEAERIAARWAAAPLSSKDSRWRAAPLTEGQERYLKGLARGRLTPSEIKRLSKGEAAQWITALQAANELRRVAPRQSSTDSRYLPETV